MYKFDQVLLVDRHEKDGVITFTVNLWDNPRQTFRTWAAVMAYVSDPDNHPRD